MSTICRGRLKCGVGVGGIYFIKPESQRERLRASERESQREGGPERERARESQREPERARDSYRTSL